MTKRQWIILQAALIQLDAVAEADKSGGWAKVEFSWNSADDGEPPTHEEISEVAELVGRMTHDP